MASQEKTAALIPSVGADGEQPIFKENTVIIPEPAVECKSSVEDLEQILQQMQTMLDPDYLPAISMQELYENIYPSKGKVIEGLLYTGTYLFAGAPKAGKSFLMMQLAYHVSTGKELWGYPVHQGTVLYLALEDDYRRLQERLYRMFGTESTENLYLSVWAKQLGDGLDEQVQKFVTQHPNTRLVIIDTLQKVRELGEDKYSYANDYEIMSRLKGIADRSKICLLLVHHTRKQQAEDSFDMISGTNGLLGAADGAFLLRKEKRTGNTAILELSGRDQQDQRLHLVRDPERLLWRLERADTELWQEPVDPVLVAAAGLVSPDRPEWSGTATELAEILKIDIKPNALAMRLNIRAGKLMEEYHVQYESSRGHTGRKITLTLMQM